MLDCADVYVDATLPWELAHARVDLRGRGNAPSRLDRTRTDAAGLPSDFSWSARNASQLPRPRSGAWRTTAPAAEGVLRVALGLGRRRTLHRIAGAARLPASAPERAAAPSRARRTREPLAQEEATPCPFEQIARARGRSRTRRRATAPRTSSSLSATYALGVELARRAPALRASRGTPIRSRARAPRRALGRVHEARREPARGPRLGDDEVLDVDAAGTGGIFFDQGRSAIRLRSSVDCVVRRRCRRGEPPRSAGSTTKQRTEGLSSGVNRRSTSRSSASRVRRRTATAVDAQVRDRHGSFPPARRKDRRVDDPGRARARTRNSTAIVSARICQTGAMAGLTRSSRLSTSASPPLLPRKARRPLGRSARIPR